MRWDNFPMDKLLDVTIRWVGGALIVGFFALVIGSILLDVVS